MTPQEAVTALLEEFDLPSFEDAIRDEAKYDEAWDGLSQDHPRVQRFREVCRVLREATARDAIRRERPSR